MTLDRLTPREREVLELLKDGWTDDEIGRRMGISENTVGRHLLHIYAKLGVSKRIEAARFLIIESAA